MARGKRAWRSSGSEPSGELEATPAQTVSPHLQKRERWRQPALRRLWRAARSSSGGGSGGVQPRPGPPAPHPHLHPMPPATAAGPAASLPLLQVWPSTESPLTETEGQSVLVLSSPASPPPEEHLPAERDAEIAGVGGRRRGGGGLLHPEHARLMRQSRLEEATAAPAPAPAPRLSPASSTASSLGSERPRTDLMYELLDDRRRSSTLTARYSLFDALDLEYALLRAAARGSVGPYSLSESLHKLTFTQSLAFPALARGMAAKRGRARAPHHHTCTTAEPALNIFAKMLTTLVLVLVSVLVFGLVYNLVRRGGRAQEPWVLGLHAENIARVHHRRSIHDICVDLQRWMGSRSANPRRRLSLRTSATLLYGAVRAYDMQVRELYSDAVELMTDKNKIRRSSTTSSLRYSDTTSSEKNSESKICNSDIDVAEDAQSPSPEVMRHRVPSYIWSDVSSIDSSSEATPKKAMTVSRHEMMDVSCARETNVFEKNIPSGVSELGSSSHTQSRRDENMETESDSDSEDDEEEDEEKEVDQEREERNSELSGKSKPSTVTSRSERLTLRASVGSKYSDCVHFMSNSETVDVATQTDPLPKRAKVASHSHNTNATKPVKYSKAYVDTLPFGLSLVYNSRRNPYPSQIIMSFLNPNVLADLESKMAK